MKATRSMSRRSFLGRISGGAVAVGAMAALGGCATLESDADPYDPIGGRGGGRRRRRRDDDDDGRGRGGGGGCSDSDSGRNADPAGRGRRCR